MSSSDNKDWWLYKQLRSQVMFDLKNHISPNYFSETNSIKLHQSIDNAGYYESEMQWGINATILGKKLFFDETHIMSAREKSASEVMMHLGMLTSAVANNKVLNDIVRKANELKADDGNASQVANQFKNSIIPTFQNNLKEGLLRYSKHFIETERAVFLDILPKEKKKLLLKLYYWFIYEVLPDLTTKTIVGILAALILGFFTFSFIN